MHVLENYIFPPYFTFKREYLGNSVFNDMKVFESQIQFLAVLLLILKKIGLPRRLSIIISTKVYA